MVKAVVGEESQLKLAEDRLSQAALPSEVLRWSWISAFPTFFFFFLFFFPLNFVDDLLIKFSQVGLVIGKLNKNLDRGFVFDLIPTPQNDAGEPASSVIDSVKDDNKKKGSKGKAQSDSSLLFIDKDWIAEHARQV